MLNSTKIVLLLSLLFFLFSCSKDKENEILENPCQSDCLVKKEVSTSPRTNIVFTTTNEYIRVANKKLLSKSIIVISSSNEYYIWTYKYDNLGNILEFSNKAISTANEDLITDITQKYIYENGKVVRKNSYQDNELYEYVIYEYTQGIDKYTKTTTYDKEDQTNFYETYQYDSRGNTTKMSFYTANQLESYITFEFDENNNEIARKGISVSTTLVEENISVYKECLLLKTEHIRNGQVLSTTKNRIENGLIIAQEVVDNKGEITRNYTYEYDCE